MVFIKSKTFKTLLASLFICLAASIPAFAATTGGAIVTADALNLRGGAGASSEIKAVLPGGAIAVVEEKLDGWYKVACRGTEGYVSAAYVEFSETLDGDFATKCEISGSSVRLRTGPSLEAEVLGYANTGESFSVTGVSGSWVKVKNDRVGECFVSGDYLRFDGGVAADMSEAGRLVETAKSYLGCRYVWGGMSPAGFDCSGFVNYVYDLYGYDLDRVAQSIYNNNGTYISGDSLQKGDILCFGSSGKSINHVGLYIGEGKFIHAGSSATGVIITDLADSKYYSGRLMGAKRIIGQ